MPRERLNIIEGIAFEFYERLEKLDPSDGGKVE